MSVLVINPGSTSTKVAVFTDKDLVVSREFVHDRADLARFASVMEQAEYRGQAVRTVLDEEDVDIEAIEAVCGRGGLLHPLPGGTYEVSDDMLDDLRSARYGEHPCNLGAVLAHELASEWRVPAYVVDPVVTDELVDEARLTGLPGVQRRSLFHALNQRGAARTVARKLGVDYTQSNFLVCHMGGGISMGAHRQGRIVDVVNALDGEGPFSPERTGGLPLLPVLDMIERGERSIPEMKRIILREGGVYAHLGTNDMRAVEVRAETGDAQAIRVLDAMAYSISRHVASLAPALADAGGEVEVTAVVLTGGMARSKVIVGAVRQRMGFLGPVQVVPGEEEMRSLAAGAYRVLGGTERARVYARR